MKGKLKFFFLKIKNKNEVIGDPTVNMDVDVVFGERSFNLTTGKLPPGGS